MGGASKTQAPVTTGSASNRQLYPLTDDDNPITEEEAEPVPVPVPGVSPTLVDVDPTTMLGSVPPTSDSELTQLSDLESS